MNLPALMTSPELAEFIINTGLHSLIFTGLITLGLIGIRKWSPFILSGGLLTAFLVLAFLPLIELLPQSQATTWWTWEVTPSVVESAPAAPTIPIPVEALPAAIETTVPLQQQPWWQWDTVILANLLGSIWLLGVVAMMARLVRAAWQLARIRRQLRPVEDTRVLAVWQAICERHDWASSIHLSEWNQHCSPFATGLRDVHIVLPTPFLKQASERELSDALWHEATHVAQHDLWLTALQRVVRTLYWWNPLLHWLEQHLSLSREKLCDLAVVKETGQPKAYATTLVALADQLSQFRPLPEPTAKMASSFSLLEERIRNIARKNMTMNTPRIQRITWTIGTTAVLISLLTFGIKASWAAPPSPKATLQSAGNDAVNLVMTPDGMAVTVTGEDGREKTITVPINNASTARQLTDLIQTLAEQSAPVLPGADSSTTTAGATASALGGDIYASSADSTPAISNEVSSSSNTFTASTGTATLSFSTPTRSETVAITTEPAIAENVNPYVVTSQRPSTRVRASNQWTGSSSASTGTATVTAGRRSTASSAQRPARVGSTTASRPKHSSQFQSSNGNPFQVTTGSSSSGRSSATPRRGRSKSSSRFPSNLNAPIPSKPRPLRPSLFGEPAQPPQPGIGNAPAPIEPQAPAIAPTRPALPGISPLEPAVPVEPAAPVATVPQPIQPSPAAEPYNPQALLEAIESLQKRIKALERQSQRANPTPVPSETTVY